MSKYLIASLAVVLALVVVFLSVEKPEPIIEPAPPSSRNAAEEEQLRKPSLNGEPGQKKDKPYPKLQARNIFSADGAYALSPGQKSLSEGSFTLLGVIGGKSKKAIFRDQSGVILAVGEGEPLLDGAVISRIERLSVTVERGAVQKQYVLFDMKAGSPR